MTDLKDFRKELRRRSNRVNFNPENLSEEKLNLLWESSDESKVKGGKAEIIHEGRKIEPPSRLDDEVILEYFIDGSPRTLKVEDVEINNVTYPVFLAHSVAVAVKCSNLTFPAAIKEERAIILPYATDINFADGEEFILDGMVWRLTVPDCSGIAQGDYLGIRARCRGKTEGLMANLEKSLTEELSKNSQGLVVKDGTLLEWKELYKPVSHRIVGLTKRIVLTPRVEKDGEDLGHTYLHQVAGRLRLGERSEVFKLWPKPEDEDRFVYAWFVRLHQPRTHPFEGILKPELPNHEKYEDKDFRLATIDAISYQLWRLRTPSDYDSRRHQTWLYPIRRAEEIAKGLLFSESRLKQIYMRSGK